MGNNMAAFVLDRRGDPLMSCKERRARILLERGRARIHKLKPFTIRLIDRLVEDSVLQPIACKIDPGSKETGIALVREDENLAAVIGLIEVSYSCYQNAAKSPWIHPISIYTNASPNNECIICLRSSGSYLFNKSRVLRREQSPLNKAGFVKSILLDLTPDVRSNINFYTSCQQKKPSSDEQ